MDYLHQREIAHLDIKSPNILVWKFPLQFSSRQDRVEHATEVLVKIADYGTSRISTLHGIISTNPIGTPGYMAPELFSHQGQEISPDKVSCVYMCVCVLYVCVYVCMYVCMYVCVYVCVYVALCVYVCVVECCYFCLPKVDVFAFGMTIYELLTMRPPFDELPLKEPAILHRHVRDGKRPLLADKVIIVT